MEESPNNPPASPASHDDSEEIVSKAVSSGRFTRRRSMTLSLSHRPRLQRPTSPYMSDDEDIDNIDNEDIDGELDFSHHHHAAKNDLKISGKTTPPASEHVDFMPNSQCDEEGRFVPTSAPSSKPRVLSSSKLLSTLAFGVVILLFVIQFSGTQTNHIRGFKKDGDVGMDGDLQPKDPVLPSSSNMANTAPDKHGASISVTQGADTMKERIQARSRDRVLEKFGPGPHQVELQIQLPSQPHVHSIKIELASLDSMPHSVHTFLEQIHQNVWERSLINLEDGQNMLTAEPLSQAKEENTTSQADDGMDVPELMFAEYNDQFSNDKYTVSFTGLVEGESNNGGLSINLQSTKRKLSEDSDNGVGTSCFGKIVDNRSRKVVNQMGSISRLVQGGFVQDSVTVMGARII